MSIYTFSFFFFKQKPAYERLIGDWSSDVCASDLLAMRGRVVVCGTASISRVDEWPTGPRVERHLLVKRARMEGFVIFDHMDRYGAALEQLRTWIAEGRLKWEEDILEGIETCPDAIAGLYRGENKGKRLIRLV